MTTQTRFRDAAGTLRTLARCRVRDETGVLRFIRRISIRDASGILRLVYRSMSAAASPTSVTQSGATSTIITGSSSTATPTGGTAPFTYLWKAAPYNSDDIDPSTPTAAATTFRRPFCASGDTYIGDFYCTITDALGDTADTGMVAVSITRT